MSTYNLSLVKSSFANIGCLSLWLMVLGTRRFLADNVRGLAFLNLFFRWSIWIRALFNCFGHCFTLHPVFTWGKNQLPLNSFSVSLLFLCCMYMVVLHVAALRSLRFAASFVYRSMLEWENLPAFIVACLTCVEMMQGNHSCGGLETRQRTTRAVHGALFTFEIARCWGITNTLHTYQVKSSQNSHYKWYQPLISMSQTTIIDAFLLWGMYFSGDLDVLSNICCSDWSI